MRRAKSKNIKVTLAIAALLSSLSYSQAADPKSYVECLSDINMSQVDMEISAEALKDANTFSEKFMGKILSMLPKSLEEEVIRLAGATAREMQDFKTQVGENGGFFGEPEDKIMNEKLQVALKTFYAYHPTDDRYMVLLTPEGKVYYAKVSEKGIAEEKISKKFTLKDSSRNYYFSIYHDIKCKKNCDNFLWMVDSAPVNNQKTAVVKSADFPNLTATLVSGTDAETLARVLWEDEVKYGLAKVVGVEKAQKLPGNIVLPDPQDNGKYNKQKFAAALRSCEKSVASKKDKELLAQAIALL